MTKLKPTEQILAQWTPLVRPKDGQRFQHYKGGMYEVVATGFLEDSEAPCVVYRSLEKNIVWVRTAKDFLEHIEYDGRMQPRFKSVE